MGNRSPSGTYMGIHHQAEGLSRESGMFNRRSLALWRVLLATEACIAMHMLLLLQLELRSGVELPDVQA